MFIWLLAIIIGATWTFAASVIDSNLKYSRVRFIDSLKKNRKPFVFSVLSPVLIPVIVVKYISKDLKTDVSEIINFKKEEKEDENSSDYTAK